MRPEDIVRFVVNKRNKASKVSIQKITFLADAEFALRRKFAHIVLSPWGYHVRIRGETGLEYYQAKLGPFSPRLQNAMKRLLRDGEIEEIFEDGRFLYVPTERIKEPKLKEYFVRVLEKYIEWSDSKLIKEALKRSKYSKIVERPIRI